MNDLIKVVIADDDHIVLRGLQRLINWNEYGYDVVSTFDNGVDLENFCRSNDVDLVITDIEMPRKNGFEALNLLIEEKKGLHIIIISGFDRFDYAKKAIDKGVFSYLLKPLNPVELISTLKKLKDKINNQQSQLIITKFDKARPKDVFEIVKATKLKIDSNTDHGLTLEDIAKDSYINSNYLSRAFKNIVGESFIEYRNRKKIQLAKQLLSTTHYKLYEVAEILGFEDERYFSRVFKKYASVSPKEFRREKYE